MRRLLTYFSENYKKFLLVLLLVPAVFLVEQMEFPKIDAFIRDSLQFLNDGDEVDKRIVTVNVDTEDGKFHRPLDLIQIQEIIERVQMQKPSKILLMVSPEELPNPENDPDLKRSKALVGYLNSQPNLYFFSIDSLAQNRSLSKEIIYRDFPRQVKLDISSDVSTGGMDNKRRRAIISYDKTGVTENFSAFSPLGLSFLPPSNYLYPLRLFETTQVYFKHFKLGTFGNINASQLNASFDGSLENKIVFLGTFDEYSFLSPKSVFNLFQRQKENNFKAVYFPISDHIANYVNMHLTGDYIKLYKLNDPVVLFFLLAILILVNIPIRMKIFYFVLIIPICLFSTAALYKIGNVYVDLSRTLALLAALQFFGLPLIMYSVFKEQERAKMNAINAARIDSLLLIAEKVAHDIRSPLSAINLIISKLNFDKPEYKEIVSGSINRIDEIASSVLTKYKTDFGINYEFQERFNPASLIFSIIAEKKVLNSSIRYIFDEANPELQVLGHRLEFERVLSNLTDNSIFALRSVTSPTIRFYFEESPSELTIYLHDNGTGIEANILKILGTTRVTTKNSEIELGAGIGFLHSKRLIERMNGKLQILPNDEMGTLVSITLRKA